MSSDQAYYTRRYVRYAETHGLAAICVRRNNVDSMYYVHPDRLGSYTHITNTNQQVIRNLHFDPWGNVKNDANWKMFDTTTLSGSLAGTFRFSRGFTGHEHYADLKIINMKAPSKREQKQACLIFVEREVLRDEVSTYGRLYDPVIARFFSPDNFVQVPETYMAMDEKNLLFNNAGDCMRVILLNEGKGLKYSIYSIGAMSDTLLIKEGEQVDQPLEINETRDYAYTVCSIVLPRKMKKKYGL